MPWLDGTTTARAHEQLEPLDEAVFSRTGTLVAAAGAGRFYVTRDASILWVVAACGTAPTDADILVDVNLNGTTIFTTQGNRPSILDGAYKVAGQAFPDVQALVAGDLLSVDIDQVGSSIAGADLTVVIVMAVA